MKPPRRFFRPRFTLAALLALITLSAFPLAYIAQRRAWNLQRQAIYESLKSKAFRFRFAGPMPAGSVVSAPVPPPAAKSGWLAKTWSDLCLDDLVPGIQSFGSAQWTYSKRDEKPQLTDDELRLVAEYFPEIECIYLAVEPRITDGGVAALARLPKLDTLSLHQTNRVTGVFLQQFPQEHRLRGLQLQELPQLDGRRLHPLTKLSALRWFDLTNAPQISDETLQGVDLPGSLERLTVIGNGRFDATLSRWLRQTQLELLHLDADVSREIAPALATQTKLIKLEIKNAPLVDDDFAFLANCAELSHLQLECLPIEGQFLHRLAAPEELCSLSLRATLLSDDSLPALRRFKNAERLFLDWTPIRGEGFSGKMKWPNIQEISLIGCRFSEQGKALFSQISGLNEVLLPENWTAEDLKRFSPQRMPKLSALSLVQPHDPNLALPRHIPTRARLDEMLTNRCPVEAMKPVEEILQTGRETQEKWNRKELPPR